MTWVCNPCGPIPASEVEGLTHDSPHGQERHTVCESDHVWLDDLVPNAASCCAPKHPKHAERTETA